MGCPQMGWGGYKLLLSESDGRGVGATAGGGKLNMNPPGEGEVAEPAAAPPARLLLGVP